MDEEVKKVINTFVKSHVGPLIEDLSDQALQLKFDKGAITKLAGWKKLVFIDRIVIYYC
jgi:hypothetical protein